MNCPGCLGPTEKTDSMAQLVEDGEVRRPSWVRVNAVYCSVCDAYWLPEQFI